MNGLFCGLGNLFGRGDECGCGSCTTFLIILLLLTFCGKCHFDWCTIIIVLFLISACGKGDCDYENEKTCFGR